MLRLRIVRREALGKGLAVLVLRVQLQPIDTHTHAMSKCIDMLIKLIQTYCFWLMVHRKVLRQMVHWLHITNDECRDYRQRERASTPTYFVFAASLLFSWLLPPAWAAFALRSLEI